MRRLFWLAMGITIGVMIVRKLQMAADALKPNSLAQRAGRGANSLSEAAVSFWADVKQASREREAELREGVGLDGDLNAKPEDFQ